MNTRRKTSTRVGYEIVNTGANFQGNQVPLQMQPAANEQVPVIPLAMTDREVREVPLKWPKPSQP